MLIIRFITQADKSLSVSQPSSKTELLFFRAENVETLKTHVTNMKDVAIMKFFEKHGNTNLIDKFLWKHVAHHVLDDPNHFIMSINANDTLTNTLCLLLEKHANHP